MNDELEQYISIHQETSEKSKSFVEYLYELMDKYHIDKASEIYKKAYISKQLWSSIISEKSMPSLNVCIKIALALKVNNHECKYLLKKAGFTLASSSRFALIIRYCIESKIYDIFEVNELLESHGCQNQLLD